VSERPLISFAVIGLNEADRLGECLRSIAACDYPADRVEIIYVDGGSTDDSVDIARSFESVLVIELDDPAPNAAKGRNAGWRRSRGDFVQFLDADMTLAPTWPAAAVDFARREGAKVCFGHVREKDPGRNRYHHIMDIIWRRAPGEASGLGGAFFIAKDLLERHGGFEEKLQGGEEPELAERLIRGGARIVCLDEPMAFHDAAITGLAGYWDRMRRFGKTSVEALRLRGKGTARLLLEPVKTMLPGCLLLACVVAAFLVHPLFALAAAALAAAFILRYGMSRRPLLKDGREFVLYGTHLLFAKLPVFVGQLSALFRKKPTAD